MSSIQYLLVSLAAIVLLLGIEIFLSMRKSKWPGLIPLVMVTALVICMNIGITAKGNSYTKELLKAQDSNGNHLEMTVRYDKEGKLVDFSEMRIRDRGNRLVDKVFLSFDDMGNMEDTDSMKLYESSVRLLLGGRILTGLSLFDEETNGSMVKTESGYIKIGNWAAVTVIIVLPMLLVYLIGRWAVKAKLRKAELKKIRVESL